MPSSDFTATGSSRVLIPGLLNLVHTTNPGVAFGLLADSPTAWLAPVLILFSVVGDRAAGVAARHRARRQAGWGSGAWR